MQYMSVILFIISTSISTLRPASLGIPVAHFGRMLIAWLCLLNYFSNQHAITVTVSACCKKCVFLSLQAFSSEVTVFLSLLVMFGDWHVTKLDEAL
jgi:hypothetical protein